MLLGTVTYNICKDWDLETLIGKLEEAGFEAVQRFEGDPQAEENEQPPPAVHAMTAGESAFQRRQIVIH